MSGVIDGVQNKGGIRLGGSHENETDRNIW